MSDAAVDLREIRTRKAVYSTAWHDALLAEMAERAGVSVSCVVRRLVELAAVDFDGQLFTDEFKPNDERVAALLRKSRRAVGSPFDKDGRGVLSGYGAERRAHRSAGFSSIGSQ